VAALLPRAQHREARASRLRGVGHPCGPGAPARSQRARAPGRTTASDTPRVATNLTRAAHRGARVWTA
jgi:hypothetical protein